MNKFTTNSGNYINYHVSSSAKPIYMKPVDSSNAKLDSIWILQDRRNITPKEQEK